MSNITSYIVTSLIVSSYPLIALLFSSVHVLQAFMTRKILLECQLKNTKYTYLPDSINIAWRLAFIILTLNFTHVGMETCGYFLVMLF